MPRRSVGDVALVNEKLPLDSFLSVGFDNTKRAKSAEFLAVPVSHDDDVTVIIIIK